MKTVPLREVATFVRGISYKPAQRVEPYTVDSVACFRTSNVQEELDDSDVYWVPETLVKRNEQYVQEGDILVSTANSWELVGKCCWVPKLPYLASLGGFISLLRVTSNNLDKRYLYHWFNSPQTQLEARNCARQTTNIANMSLPQAEELQLPLPPLAEQRRIAAILDKADDLRRKRRAALAKLDTLLQATFLEMFGDPVVNPKGWEVRKLGSAVSYVSSGATPRGGSKVYQTLGHLFIRSQNVLMLDFDFSDAAYIDDDIHNSMQRSWVRNNDVLLNITGASIGRVNYFQGPDNEANVNQHVCIIRPKLDRLRPEYLAFHLGTPSYNDKIVGENAGATRQAFNFKQIRAFDVMFPPVALQVKFADAVRQLRCVQKNQSRSAQTVERMFAALQQRAFRGEL